MKAYLKFSLNLVAFAFVAIQFTSCSTDKTHKPGTDFTVSYENNKVWKDCNFVGVDDSTNYRYHCKLFYRKGQLMEEGDFLNDSFPVGWHTHYRRNGSIKSKKEWFPIDTKKIALNCVISYNQNGTISKKESNYFEIKMSSDTIKVNQPMQVAFMLTAPYYKESKLYVFLFADNDTTPLMLQSESDFVVWMNTPEVKGKHNLHGYFEELNVLDKTGDSLKVQGRKLYFKQDYFVAEK